MLALLNKLLGKLAQELKNRIRTAAYICEAYLTPSQEGIDLLPNVGAYPHLPLTTIKEILKGKNTDQQVQLVAYPTSLQGNDDTVFLGVHDRTCLQELLVVIDAGHDYGPELTHPLTLSKLLRINGVITQGESDPSGLELHATSIYGYSSKLFYEATYRAAV